MTRRRLADLLLGATLVACATVPPLWTFPILVACLAAGWWTGRDRNPDAESIAAYQQTRRHLTGAQR